MQKQNNGDFIALDGVVNNLPQYISSTVSATSPSTVSKETTRDISAVSPHLQESVQRLEEAAQNLFKNLSQLREVTQNLNTARNMTLGAPTAKIEKVDASTNQAPVDHMPEKPSTSSSLKEKGAYQNALESRLHQVEKELASPQKLAKTKERIAALESAIQNLAETKPEEFEEKITELTKEKAHLAQKQEQHQQKADKIAESSYKESIEKLKGDLEQEITSAKKVETDLENAVSAVEDKLDTTSRTSLQACIHRLKELDKALASLQEYKEGLSSHDNVDNILEKREKIERKVAYLRQISALDPKERSSTNIETVKQLSERFVELARKKFPEKDQSGTAVKNPVGLELLQTFVHGSKSRAKQYTSTAQTQGAKTSQKLVKLGIGYQLERNDPLHRPWQAPPFSKYIDNWNIEVKKWDTLTEQWNSYDKVLANYGVNLKNYEDAVEKGATSVSCPEKPTPPSEARPTQESRPAPFFTWLETQNADVMPAMYKGYDWGNFDPQQSHGIDIPLEGASVLYYSQDQQQKAQVTPGTRGLATNTENAPATTVHARTEDSGPGYGTFALGEDGRLLIGSHKPGSEYHSSLFAGEPIRAAGEIRIENGQIVEITNKTGHYKTPRDQLISVLQDLKSQGYDLSQTTVRLTQVINNEKEGLSTNTTIYDTYDAETLLKNPNAPPKGVHIRVGRPERPTDQIVKDIALALRIAQRQTALPASSMKLHMFGERDAFGAKRFVTIEKKTTDVLTSLNEKVRFIKTPIQVSALQLDTENETFSMSTPTLAATYLSKH